MEFSRIALLFIFSALSAAWPSTPRTVLSVAPLLVSAAPSDSASPIFPPSTQIATPLSAAITSVSAHLFPSPTNPSFQRAVPTETSLEDPPKITLAPPPLVTGKSGEGIQLKWHLTTYYTCITRGGNENCGWHEPVLPGGDEIAGAGRMGEAGNSRWVVLTAGYLGVVVGWWLW